MEKRAGPKRKGDHSAGRPVAPWGRPRPFDDPP